MKRALAVALLAWAPSLVMAQAPADAEEVPASSPAELPPEDPDAHANGTERLPPPPAGSEEAPLAEDAALSDDASHAGPPLEDEPGEEYVLGQSSLRLDMPASPLSLAPPSVDAGESTQAAPLHRDLELALRLPTYDFDGVSFISASRSLITAVLETYCAAGLLFPGEDGYDAGEVILGAGCLLGATTLYIMGIRRILHPSEERRAVERLARFEALRSGAGLSDEDIALFENELHSAARRDRRRRIIEIIFGGLNIVATATLAGLTARDQINTTVGTSIATGTAALGLLSLSSIFVRSPSERAWSSYEAR